MVACVYVMVLVNEFEGLEAPTDLFDKICRQGENENVSQFLGPMMGFSPWAGQTSLEEGNLG